MRLRQLLKKILGAIGLVDNTDYTSIEAFRKRGVKIGKNVDIINTFIDWNFGFLCSIGDNVTLTGVRILTHDASTKKFLGYSKIGKVEIGNNVFVGNGAIILPNVKIGNNVIIGAGTIVAKDVPDNVVIAGNPWKVICTCEEYIARNKKMMESSVVSDTLCWENATEGEREQLAKQITLPHLWVQRVRSYQLRYKFKHTRFMWEFCRRLKARKQAAQLVHFESTEWGKNLRTLKGVHAGERCFIIGNGPSLKASDLDRLCDEYTFAFNRIYKIFNQTAWRPTYYCSQDEKMLRNSLADIREQIETPYFFAPINLKWYEGIDDLSTDFFFSMHSPEDFREKPAFSTDLAHQIEWSNTVAYTAIQIAVYMGFKEIYLLGVDHSFSVYQNSKGEIIKDPTAKDYFSDDYNKDKDKLYIPMLDLSTLAFESARDYADAHDIKIYNATRGGKLEVFPRVDFDTLF